MNHPTVQPSLRSITALLLVLPTLLSGCAQMNAYNDAGHTKEAREQYSRVDQHSSFPSISRANFEQVNLVEMIDPESHAESVYARLWPKDASSNDAREAYGQKYDLVLAGFRSRTDLSDEQKRQRRNSVQDKIIAVATSRCNVFKTFLRRQQTDGNFYFGSATTVASVLGALLPGARDVRNMAGAAGIFSGIQAEFNQSYYSNLAAQVIVEGIELRQSMLKERLYAGARDHSVVDYTMEAAIADALVFDGSCSALTGLVMAQDSIQQITRPGPEAAMNAMLYAQVMQAASKVDLTQTDAAGKVEALRKIPGPGAHPLIASMVLRNTSDTLASESREAVKLIENLSARLQQQALRLANHYAQVRSTYAGEASGPVTPDQVRDAYIDWARDTLLAPLTKTGTGEAVVCIAAVGRTSSAMAAAASKLALTSAESPAHVEAQKSLGIAEADARAEIRKIRHLLEATSQSAELAREEAMKGMQKAARSEDKNPFTLSGMSKVLAKQAAPSVDSAWQCTRP